MIVLVTGGRDFTDAEWVDAALSRLHRRRPITLLVHGAARGADRLADAWARAHEVPVQACPADWRKHGPGAGPIRNRAMLRDWSPILVVAFPGGSGTADMVAVAEASLVQVWHPSSPARCAD